MVADAVFLLIGVVGMRGTEHVAHVLVILRVLIGVAHDEADGTARRLTLEDATEQFHLIGFLARGCDLALSRTTAIELCLDEVHVDIDACWHAVDNASDGLTMTLAKGRQPEYRSKCIHILMTVSTAAVVAMLVVVAAATVVTAFAMMMATTMTTAREHLDGLVDLFVRGVAVLHDGTCEIERLASQGVVGVNCHTVLLDLHHLGHELMVFAICQGDNGIGEDIVVVEMAIDREYLTVDLMNALGLVGTESLLGGEGEVEGVALRMLGHFLLKGVECDAKTSNKLEGALCAGLFLEFLLTVGHCIQLVYHRHELIGCLIHTLLYIYLFQVAKVIILIQKRAFFHRNYKNFHIRAIL